MIVLMLASLALQVPQAERYGLVMVNAAGDTVAVERVVRTGTTVRSEVFDPGRARLEVVMPVDARGCAAGAEVKVFPWLSAPWPSPGRRKAGSTGPRKLPGPSNPTTPPRKKRSWTSRKRAGCASVRSPSN